MHRMWTALGIVAVAAALLAGSVLLAGCTTPSAADVASENVSTAADNFEVNRLIVGINLHTGETLFTVEGPCSITRDGDLVVICKESANPDTFRKHFFGLGNGAGYGVTYVSTQLGPVEASAFHTRIILRPTTVLPDFDLTLGTS